MLNFDFSEKDVGLVSPPHFAYDFFLKKWYKVRNSQWYSLKENCALKPHTDINVHIVYRLCDHSLSTCATSSEKLTFLTL